MNATETLSDLELILLEDDLTCASRSHWVECMHTVTHVFDSCLRKEIPICADAHAYVIKSFEDGYCQACGRDCIDCWTIRPI